MGTATATERRAAHGEEHLEAAAFGGHKQPCRLTYCQRIECVRRNAAELRRRRDEEHVSRLVGTEGGCGVCGEVFTPAGKVAHLAADRAEAIAELGGPVGVAARNAAARIVARERAELRQRLAARAAAAGWPSDVDAWIDGWNRNRNSPAIERPGPARMAFAGGWIARQLDGRKLAHEANLDGQHDELDDRSECGACTHVGELELRAIWGDR